MTKAEPWTVGGDFNACETFDSWKGGPRGNRRWLDRMADLGFTECLRHHTGRLTPTFRRPGASAAHCQIDYLFVSGELASRLGHCGTADSNIVFGNQLSDHFPIVAAFRS
jgi:exonuclease III